MFTPSSPKIKNVCLVPLTKQWKQFSACLSSLLEHKNSMTINDNGKVEPQLSSATFLGTQNSLIAL